MAWVIVTAEESVVVVGESVRGGGMNVWVAAANDFVAGNALAAAESVSPRG